MTSQPLYFELLFFTPTFTYLSSFLILVAECTQDRFPLNILTKCTVCIMIVIVFLLFSDSSKMSHFEGNIPFLNSWSLHQYGPGSLGSRDHYYHNPLNGGSESEEDLEFSVANNGSHHS